MVEGVVVARAPAKVNLSLRVAPRDQSGLHPVHSLVQSVTWHDRLEMTAGDDDRLEIVGAELPEDDENLVWRAVERLRAAGADPVPVSARLIKRLPVAAGLGGGSSDAAAALLAYAGLSGYSEPLEPLAAELGSDVPFCLSGGLQWMDGHGEILTPIRRIPDDYRVVLAVPPFGLSTPAVYRMWDDMDGPEGPELPLRAIPPGLRDHGPFGNDLYPAAVRCNPDLDDWRVELADRWDRPVALSGSGPTLFGFFADDAEASEALTLVPAPARHAAVAAPLKRGAHLEEG